jgi:levanbiose-producing levanase
VAHLARVLDSSISCNSTESDQPLMKKRSGALLSLTAATAVLLTACGGASSSSTSTSPSTAAAAASSSPASSYLPAPTTTSAAPIPDAERWLPAAHLTAGNGWASNPSGLVFENGTYHAFYQRNPTGDSQDPAAIEWAHATSTDLVTWTDQPVAIPAGADQVLSGSIVVDSDNTSGLGTTDAPPMVAIDTLTPAGASGSTQQSVAYSTDHGQTWQESARTLSLPAGLRDPKVFWYEPGGYWVMVIADPDEFAVQIYKSTNLTSWQSLSEFGKAGSQAGPWQSPDLFPLALDGDAANTKWVMLVSTTDGAIAGGSGVQYFVGSFDGTTFEAEPLGPAGVGAVQAGEQHSWADWGPDFVDATTFDNAPGDRRIALAWLNNDSYAATEPTSPWRGAMTLPRELALVTTNGVPRLTQTVPAETQSALSAATPAFSEPSIVTSGNRKLSSEASGTAFVVDATLVPGDAAVAGVTVLGSATGKTGTRIQYVKEAGILQVDRSTAGIADFAATFGTGGAAPVTLVDGKLPLHIVVDGSTVEVFAGGAAISTLVFPAEGDDAVSVFGGGGKATIENVTVTPIGAG